MVFRIIRDNLTWATILIAVGGYLLPFDYLKDIIGLWVVKIPIFQGWEPDKALLVVCLVMIFIGYLLSKKRYYRWYW